MSGSLGAVAFLLAAGGAALARHWSRRWNGAFPAGTMAVNVLGSLGLAIMVAVDVASIWLAAGGLGTLTTWSTFVRELTELGARRAWLVGSTYAVGSLGLAILGSLAILTVG